MKEKEIVISIEENFVVVKIPLKYFIDALMFSSKYKDYEKNVELNEEIAYRVFVVMAKEGFIKLTKNGYEITGKAFKYMAIQNIVEKLWKMRKKDVYKVEEYIEELSGSNK